MPFEPQPVFGGPALISSYAHAAFPGGEFFIGEVSLTWAYAGHAKAGATVVMALFDNHQPVIDNYTTPREWEQWVINTFVVVEGVAFDGIDSKGNKYTLFPGKPLGAGGFEWIAVATLTADVVPGDTLTFKFSPDIPIIAIHGEEGASVEAVFPKHEARGEAEFYAWAAVWYGGAVNLLDLPEGEETRQTLKGAGALPAETNPFSDETAATLVVADWTGSATPDGGVWESLLNGTDHGNHMIADYHRDDGATRMHAGVGTGTGHLSVVKLVAPSLQHLHAFAYDVDTEEFVPDNTYGEGEGAAKAQGKRLTITLATDGWQADAGSIAGYKVTDLTPFYTFPNWGKGTAGYLKTLLSSAGIGEGGGSAWSGVISRKVRNLWREARGRDRMPMPVVGELRIKFQVTAHTRPKWKEWNNESEPAYAASFALLKGGEVAVGDLYENGVLIGKGIPLICGDGSVPTEFVLTEDKRDKLGEGGEEKKGEWTFPLGEDALELMPLDSSRFNTLTYDWDVTATLWWPPPLEPPAFTMTQPQAISLSFVTGKEPPEPETPPKGGEETPTEEKEKLEKGEETTKEKEEKREREEREANGETGTMQIDSPVSSGVVTRNRRP